MSVVDDEHTEIDKEKPVPENHSLGYYAWKYRRYLIPAWLFYAYVICWDHVFETLHIKHLLLWAFLFVLIPFWIIYIWTYLHLTGKIPYWKRLALEGLIMFSSVVSTAVFLQIMKYVLQGWRL